MGNPKAIFRQAGLSVLFVALTALSVWGLFIRERHAAEAELRREHPNLTVIRVVSPPQEMLGGTAWSRSRAMVYRAFSERHPDFRFVSSSQLRLPGDLGNSTDVLAFLGNTAPDVYDIPDIKFAPYKEQGFALELNELIAADGLNPDDLIPPALRPLVMRNGRIYALPSACFGFGLIYRKDYFEQAGLDPNSPPETWEELYTACMKLTRDVERNGRKYRRVGMVLDRVSTTGWGDRQFLSFLYSAGGQAMVSRSAEDWDVAFQEQPGIETLRFYRRLLWGRWVRSPRTGEPVILRNAAGEQICTEAELRPLAGARLTGRDAADTFVLDLTRVEKGCAAISTKMNSADFAEGDAAINVHMPYFGVQNLVKGPLQLSPACVGVAPMPRGPGPGGAHRAYAEYHFACLNGTLDPAKDRARIRAAWEYLKFVASDEVKRIDTQAYVDEGEFLFVNPTCLKRFGFADCCAELPAGWLDGFAAIEKGLTPVPASPQYRNVALAWGYPVSSVFLYEDADPAQLLRTCAAEVRASVLQKHPPAAMARYKRVARLLGGCGVALVIFCLWKALTGTRRQLRANAKARAGTPLGVRGHLRAWLLLAPACLLILLWSYSPLAWGSLIAFFHFRVLEGFLHSRFAGMENFIEVVLDPLFGRVVLNTLLFVLLNIGLGFCAPILLAVLLSEVPRGKTLFRVIYFLPAVTSSLVIVLMWSQFFDSGPAGVLNALLGVLGLPSQRWLADPNWAMFCTIVPAVWGGMGPGCLIYLAALKSVPEECYEAAEIDGAGFFRKLWSVTLPTISSLVLINFLGVFIGTFQGMGNILLMTGGGPLNATRVLGLEIWMKAFINLDYGRSTALAWILGSGLIGFTVLQLQLISRARFERAKGFDTCP